MDSLQKKIKEFKERIEDLESLLRTKNYGEISKKLNSEDSKSSISVEENINATSSAPLETIGLDEIALSQENANDHFLNNELEEKSENGEKLTSEALKCDTNSRLEESPLVDSHKNSVSGEYEELDKKDIHEKQLGTQHDESLVDRDLKSVDNESFSEAKFKEKEEKNGSLERQIGEKLTVWVGGVALALAGIFMVKYSIEKGYLNEKVRVIVGFLFGLVLLTAGHIIRNKPHFANGTRISQALSGAGIATLYGVIYAATNMYHITSDWVGFFGMSFVTAIAVILSLKHGMPIALLGMVGGYLAPAFVGPNEPPAIILFGYLYLLYGGLLFLIRQKKWWELILPTAILTFIWLLYWLLNSYQPKDSLVLALFLFSLVTTVIYCTKEAVNDADWSLAISAFNGFIFVIAIFFMTLIVDKADYGWLEWGLYALMSMGSIVLSAYNGKTFKFAPWFTSLINLVILIIWDSNDTAKISIILSGFSLIYLVSCYFFLFRRKWPWYWGCLTVVTALSYFLLAFYKLNNTEFMEFIPLTWAFLSLIMSVILLISVWSFEKIYANDENKSKVQFLFYALLGAFVTLTLTIEIDPSFHWELCGLLCAGAIALAFFDEKNFSFVPYLSMLFTALIVYNFETPKEFNVAITIFIFSIINILPSLIFYWRNYSSVQWSGLFGLTSICYYLLAYFKLRQADMFNTIPYFWGFMAFALAGFAFIFLRSVMNKLSEDQIRDRLLTIFTVATTTFVSLALTIELQKDFLPVAIAMEIVVIAWINNRVVIQCLRSIIGVLAFIFGLLLIPQILLLGQISLYSILELELKLQESVPIVEWPLFQLGFPAIMFIGTSLCLKKQKDNWQVQVFEYASVALIGIMGYYLTRHIFHREASVIFVKSGFFERGVITNVFFAFSLICFFIGRIYNRAAYSTSGIVLFCISLIRLILFDLMIHNPIWANQRIDGVVIFNGLTITYGFSVFWIIKGCHELKLMNFESFVYVISKLSFLFLFIWCTYNVRFYFHQPFLSKGQFSNAEIYSYSAVWLVLGVGFLIVGISLKSKSLRIASLGMMVLTVAKVFLYDASELQGLLRVGSFLGLGLCFIGLSYFYSRFVFGKNRKNSI